MPQQRNTIEFIDFFRMILSVDLTEGVTVTGRTRDGTEVELGLTAEALAKLEAFIARANLEQAKRQPSH